MRRVALVALTLALLCAAARAAPPPGVSLDAEQRLVVGRLAAILAEEAVARQLESGLTTTFVFRAEVAGRVLGGARVDVRYNLWDEVFAVVGSSIRGFQAIHESDMLLILDASTAFIDPVLEVPTLVIVCDVYDPLTRQPYSRDPRYVARKAEAYLKQTGIATTSFFGPEAEFFLFNDVRYGGEMNSSFYYIDSVEGWWQSGMELKPNYGGEIAPKRGYFPVPPSDTQQDVRSRIVLALEASGIPIEVHHHEVATGWSGRN